MKRPSMAGTYATIHGIRVRYNVGRQAARKIAGEVGYIKRGGRILVKLSDLEAHEVKGLIVDPERSTIKPTTSIATSGAWKKNKAPGDLSGDWWNE